METTENPIQTFLNALGRAHVPLESVPLDLFKRFLDERASDHPIDVQVRPLVDAAIAFRNVSREAAALDKAIGAAGGMVRTGGES